MPYVWSFYALNETLDIEQSQSSLEQALHAKLRVEKHGDGNSSRKNQLIQELNSSSNIFATLSDESLQLPTILAYSGERSALGVCKEWLQSTLGLIVTPIVLDSKALLEVADASSTGALYNTKLVFNVDTETQNLSRMEIEIDKTSLQALTQSKVSLYSEALVSYLYNETGMKLLSLPLVSIYLTGNSRIGKSQITTIEAEIDDAVLQAILRSTQYQV